ncbi:hypothetical protein AN232_22230 [Citrobacter sp. CRE-46]|nr:hypothetical protein AN232_22230 [Citrobacter sp. CRE-46]
MPSPYPSPTWRGNKGSTPFPKYFALQEGGKPVNPRELTLVSDRGEQVKPTHLQRERRREISRRYLYYAGNLRSYR